MLRRPLATGAGLAAAVSLGEFGATSFLSRTGSDTLPIAIERLLGRTGSLFQAQAFALATPFAASGRASSNGGLDPTSPPTRSWSISRPTTTTCR